MKNWLETKRQLLKQIKSQVDGLLGESSNELAPLQDLYSEEFTREWRPSSNAEVIDSMLRTQLVIGGDFHAFAQSQRAHLRILRSLPTAMPLFLVLECFKVQDQVFIDQLLSGAISENHFLESVDWEQSWGFPWEQYRPLLQTAKQKGFHVVGLNTLAGAMDLESLDERESAAAQVILDLRQKNPSSLIFILFGDLHLSESRFPTALRKAFKEETLSITRIFQNSEELYFQLAEKGLESQVEVMASADPETFCLLSSPPWVKWQSYLIYLEQTYDLDLEDDDDDDQMDFSDHVHTMVQLLVKDFELDVAADELSVYTLADDLEAIFAECLSSRALERVQYLVRSDRSFVLPETGQLFLSRFSINHAAGLAGMHLHFKCMKAVEMKWDIEDHFEAWIWIEAIAFFCSKWINHKRKPDSLPQLKAQLSALDESTQGRRAMVLAMEQRLREVSFSSLDKLSHEISGSKKDFADYFEASKILGSMLGDKMHLAVKSDLLPLEILRGWMQQPVFSEGFANFYYQAVRQMESYRVDTKL